MRYTCHLLVLVSLMLFSANAAANATLRVASIQPMAGEEFLSSIAAAELTSIDVNIINTGAQICSSGSATLTLFEAETNQKVVNELSHTFEVLEPGQSTIQQFSRNELENLVNSPPGNYRARAQALCNGTLEHSRSFIFSLVEKQKIGVPETNAFVVGTLALVLLWMIFGRSPGKHTQNP